ncbi:hypothetical protein RE428_17730 [Marinobacter nanhaiticus D15-8W]|uniref:Uncharacterized protein n=1 Tax=Marinobacter nanhaiticus D15-8W TaxID=626887 RepID=N6WX31_9GAMM|nr:hypothetical protein J057_18370 [Marinobacter nanhaiticus D15-8W]BES70755.1 hypothetical protein RE428_17730 [Marinobacter nanhaiticus D15-8W]
MAGAFFWFIADQRDGELGAFRTSRKTMGAFSASEAEASATCSSYLANLPDASASDQTVGLPILGMLSVMRIPAKVR